MTLVKKLFCFSTLLLTLTFLSSCGGSNRQNAQQQEDAAATETVEASLVFDNVTLDEADEQGRPLWQIKAKQVSYSQDKKKAEVEKPTGDLFQDGELVLQVSAAKGVIQEDGKTVILKGQIVAVDPRNKAVMRGDEVEWKPQDDVLLVRNNFTGTHPQFQATAKEGKYFTRDRRMELQGQIVGVSQDPPLQLKTEQLTWQVAQQKLFANRGVQIDRYQGQNVSDRVVGNQAEFNLETKIANLKQNVQLSSVEPPIDIATDSATWNMKAQTVVSDRPVRILHRQEQVTVTANRGQIDLQQKVAVLTGSTQGVSTRNQAQLRANQLRWEIPTQQIKADGNVVYKQTNPSMTLAGSSGVGTLQDQTFVVSSTSSTRVETVIIP